MIDLEKIEETYKKELEENEKVFLKGITNKENLDELEKNYRAEIEDIRKKYYDSMSGFIKKQKVAASKLKKKKNKAEEVVKPLNVQPKNFDLTFSQRMKFKFKLKKFMIWFKLRNFRRSHTPNFISFNYIRVKIKTKKILFKLHDLLIRLLEAIKTLLQKIFNGLKGFAKAALKKLVNIPERILSIFKKRKSSEEGKEKKEDNKEASA